LAEAGTHRYRGRRGALPPFGRNQLMIRLAYAYASSRLGQHGCMHAHGMERLIFLAYRVVLHGNDRYDTVASSGSTIPRLTHRSSHLDGCRRSRVHDDLAVESQWYPRHENSSTVEH
jgi:hypothetical protein